jgi:LPS-assembly protein
VNFISPTRTRAHLGLATALPLILTLAATPAFAQLAGSNVGAGVMGGGLHGHDENSASVGTGAYGASDNGRPALISPSAAPGTTSALTVNGVEKPLANDEVVFTSDTLDYDYKSHIVTATGEVRMMRQGNRLRADKVEWDRETGQVHAYGNVAVQNPQGDITYGKELQLTDDLKDGVIEDLLLVLENGGRMAATTGGRANGVYTLTHAAYTPCDVTTSKGCPKNPIWKITAARVVYDPNKHRLSYRDARLTFLQVPILWLPAFSHPDGSGQGGSSGLLVPDISYNARNGLMVATPYYIQFAPNRDLTVTPYAFSAVLPMMEMEYRQLDSRGAWRMQGYVTDSSQSTSNIGPESKSVRGYFEANGTFQFGPNWTVSASVRGVSDRTFLQRYDLNYDDTLRSTINAERIDNDSYLSIAGWAFQTLVPGEKQSAQPIAIPAIDYRRRIEDPWLGGTFTLQANTLSLVRPEGQDTQRAFASAQWEKWALTPWGQQLTFTAYGRGDVYHSSNNDLTQTVIYQGQPGWQTRAIGALALDVRWPFVGEIFGGTQRITPRVQIVGSPHTKNLAIPDEDARAIDLEDSNLFALNRFPGYDRWEDDSRITYGAEYTLDLPRFALRSVVGQSYRLSNPLDIFPPGTGLSSKLSDIVGRLSVRYGNYLSITERFRLDKNNFAIRTNEIDAQFGSSQTYLQIGYLNLNRHIDPAIEDLRDHEEVRLGARLAIGKRWSLFGSTTLDLTGDANSSATTGPTNPALDQTLDENVDPVKSRVGIDYQDDCFEFSVQWRRDYVSIGDARRGDTIQFRLAFKNLGR